MTCQSHRGRKHWGYCVPFLLGGGSGIVNHIQPLAASGDYNCHQCKCCQEITLSSQRMYCTNTKKIKKYRFASSNAPRLAGQLHLHRWSASASSSTDSQRTLGVSSAARVLACLPQAAAASFATTSPENRPLGGIARDILPVQTQQRTILVLL